MSDSSTFIVMRKGFVDMLIKKMEAYKAEDGWKITGRLDNVFDDYTLYKVNRVGIYGWLEIERPNPNGEYISENGVSIDCEDIGVAVDCLEITKDDEGWTIQQLIDAVKEDLQEVFSKNKNKDKLIVNTAGDGYE
jgi:hypothetical protein